MKNQFLAFAGCQVPNNLVAWLMASAIAGIAASKHILGLPRYLQHRSWLIAAARIACSVAIVAGNTRGVSYVLMIHARMMHIQLKGPTIYLPKLFLSFILDRANWSVMPNLVSGLYTFLPGTP